MGFDRGPGVRTVVKPKGACGPDFIVKPAVPLPSRVRW